MAINIVDPMAELDALVNEEQKKSSGFAPFFFSIQDGQKALVRPLLNMNEYVRVDKHEVYNPATNKFDVASVCASSLNLEGCIHCAKCATAKSKEEKKLIASPRIVLAVYVHAVLEVKTGQPVTYKKKNEDGSETELPVKGIRLLEMKRTSSVLRDLMANYNELDNHDISTVDFVITRKNIDGDKLQTTYTVISKAPRDIKDEIPEWTHDRDLVLLQYADACPFAIIDSDVKLDTSAFNAPAKSAAAAKVKNVPDF